MAEEQSRRIEQEVTKIVDDLDKSYLRKMQYDMHMCAAKCCEDRSKPMDSVQNCIERCTNPVTRAQNYVQSEMQYFQKRLQRCVMDCNDTIRDKMPSNPNQDQISRYTGEFEACATKCVDQTINKLPDLVKRMKATLSQGNIPDSVGE